MTDNPTLLLVHGAWHGAWCWQQLREVLEGRGWVVATVDLPTVAATDNAGVPMRADAEEVASAIEAIDGDVVVVAHSYGGVPVSEAAGAPSVQHIVYVCAFVLDVGESLLGAVGGTAPPWWHVDGQLVTAGNEQHPVRELFYGDVDPSVADACESRLAPHSLLAFTDATTAAAWHDNPSTYVIAEHDGAIPVFAQEAMAQRTGESVRMATSHSPFLSQPEALADIIESAARSEHSR